MSGGSRRSTMIVSSQSSRGYEASSNFGPSSPRNQANSTSVTTQQNQRSVSFPLDGQGEAVPPVIDDTMYDIPDKTVCYDCGLCCVSCFKRLFYTFCFCCKRKVPHEPTTQSVNPEGWSQRNRKPRPGSQYSALYNQHYHHPIITYRRGDPLDILNNPMYMGLGVGEANSPGHREYQMTSARDVEHRQTLVEIHEKKKSNMVRQAMASNK